MNRTPLVVGNWKMELSHKASLALAKSLKSSLQPHSLNGEIVLCPSFPTLPHIAEMFADNSIAIGAQNIHHEERGAYTGQVSITQLLSFIKWSIIGHSEVRAAFSEQEEIVVHKANLLHRHGITPIVCIGETQEERQAGKTHQKITEQVERLMQDIPRVSLIKTIIAYEPIWAIGSGLTPEPDDVAEIILLIRKMVAGRFDEQVAQRLRIIYGGSVKPDNVTSYVSGPYADGVLVGGASVHAGQFSEIVQRVFDTF